MSRTHADVHVVIVNFRSAHYLVNLLASLPGALGRLTALVTVVDNSGELVAEAGSMLPADVRLLGSGQNLGFAGGLNVALRAEWAAEWVLFINPDCVLRPTSVELLVETGRSTGAAAVVPIIQQQNGSTDLSLRRFPSVLGALGDAIAGWHFRTRWRALSEYYLRPSDYATRHTAQWAQGSVVCVRDHVVRDIGEWDESFFLYSEETDYFNRIWASGGFVVVEPAATALHVGGGSGSSAKQMLLLHLNRVELYSRSHGAFATNAYRLAIAIGLTMRSARAVERHVLTGFLSGANAHDLAQQLKAANSREVAS